MGLKNSFKKFIDNFSDSITISGTSRITINGVRYESSGGSVQINGDDVFIDGKKMTGKNTSSKILNITIEGDVKDISLASCKELTINGNVDGDIDVMDGYITVNGDVGGDVDTQNGDVACGNVDGDIDTMNGNVTCGNVRGSIDTMNGSIKTSKNG